MHSLKRILSSQSLIFAFTLIASLVLQSFARADEIVLELSNGQRDPLFEFVPPPFGSPDIVQFNEKGLLIQQVEDVEGQPTGVTGFKTIVSASGDFQITIDLEINQLDPPSDGWGHGLIFTVLLNDAKQTALKLNQISVKDSKPFTLIEISKRNEYMPFLAQHMKALKKGSLRIARMGKEVTFSMDNGKGFEEITKQQCPNADVRGVEVWSPRVAKGNAPSDILLRKLTMQADKFYPFQPTQASWFTWWRLLVVCQMVVTSIAVWYIYSRRNAK